MNRLCSNPGPPQNKRLGLGEHKKDQHRFGACVVRLDYVVWDPGVLTIQVWRVMV